MWKRKCTSLFSKEDRETIFGATKTCHQVLSESVHLLKAYYLRKYEHIYKAGEDDGVDDSLALLSNYVFNKLCFYTLWWVGLKNLKH
jgi:hypothetical protein